MSKVVVLASPAGEDKFRELLWQDITIRKSLDDICHSLELTLPVSQRQLVHKHDCIMVYYYNRHITNTGNRQLVTTVYVDEIRDTSDSRKTVSLAGRSPARDIIDSTWSESFDGSPDFLTILKSIARKFNISVKNFAEGGNDTQAVSGFSIENESPWTKILAEAENQGYTLTSSQLGGLYLTKYPREAAGFRFAEGRNIKTIERIESGAEQYHEYAVIGKGKTITLKDRECRNNRILTINLTDFDIDEEKLRTRAKRELHRRRENKVKITASGWGLSDVQLAQLAAKPNKEIFYEPNFLIPVSIPSAGIDNILLLTQTVECTASAGRMESTIELINKEAYYG